LHPETNFLLVLEKDHQAYNQRELDDKKQEVYAETKDETYLKTDWHKLGSYPRSEKDKFASCIRIVDPVTMETQSVLEFENNETCFSMYVSRAINGHAGQLAPGECLLFCGVGLESKLSPRGCAMGFIKTYRFSKDGRFLELLHSTPCEDIPSAFNEYRGKLVAGVGSILRLYELGLKKLLRKLENKSLSSPIISIRVEDSGRIFAADIAESVHVFKCKPDEQSFYIFADDTLKRWTTNFCLLDQDTVCGVDKFEGLYVNRLPAGCEDDAEDDPTASKFLWETGRLNGAAFKMEAINQYFMGETGTQVIKTQLNP